MSARAPFKRLILRAVLRNVSPMVIRVIAVSDSLSLHELDEVFRSVLGWENIGFIFHMQGLEFSSFRRATRSRTLREFQLRPSLDANSSRRETLDAEQLPTAYR